jgi:nicotinamidase-related amidase
MVRVNIMGRAVLVIDMLNEFVYGRLGGERSRAVVPCIKRLLEHARNNGIPVIYIRDSHEEGDVELDVWGEHAMKGTEEAEIIPELEPLPGEVVLEKTTYFSFHDTGLDEILTDMGVDEVIITGLLTNICVKLAAAEAFVRQYSIMIPEGCVNAVSQEEHEDALQEMRDLYKARILDLEQVID